MRIALYQPDIPQNTGNIFRLAACLGVSVDVIEPAGFLFDDKRLQRSLMDYIDYLEYSPWMLMPFEKYEDIDIEDLK